MKKITILLCFILAYFTSNGQGMDISVEGYINFNQTSFIITEAGEDFASSIVGEATSSVSIASNNFLDSTNPDRKWRVEIHKSDINWNDNLLLEIRRSGDGVGVKITGKGNGKGNGNAYAYGLYKPRIFDGTEFFPIINSPSYFFRGKNYISNIPLEFRLSGLSVIMGAQRFETDITFTIYDD